VPPLLAARLFVLSSSAGSAPLREILPEIDGFSLRTNRRFCKRCALPASGSAAPRSLNWSGLQLTERLQ